MLLLSVLAFAAATALAPDARTASVMAALGLHLNQRTGYELSPRSRFGIAFTDLNGDGRDEAVVYSLDRKFCGSGGCTTFVLAHRGKDWSWMSSTTLTQLPIYRLPTKHHAWHDIGVSVRSDYVKGGSVALRFDGKGYKSNPTIAPVTFSRGRAELIISEDRLRVLQRNH